MSNGAILIIGIVALAALGGLFLVTTARKADKNAATGLLARETVKRDRAARRQATASDSVAGFVPRRCRVAKSNGRPAVAATSRSSIVPPQFHARPWILNSSASPAASF